MDEISEQETLATESSSAVKTKTACGKRRGGFRPRKRKKSFARLGSLQRKANQRERRRAQRIRDGFRSLAEALPVSGAAGAVTTTHLSAVSDSAASAERKDETAADASLSTVNFGIEWTQISTLTTACAYIGHLGRLLGLNGGSKKIDVTVLGSSYVAQKQAAKAKRSLSDETDPSGESDVDSDVEGGYSFGHSDNERSVAKSPTEAAKCPWSLRPPAKRRWVDNLSEERLRAKTERFTFVPGESDPETRSDCNSCTLCSIWSSEEAAMLGQQQVNMRSVVAAASSQLAVETDQQVTKNGEPERSDTNTSTSHQSASEHSTTSFSGSSAGTSGSPAHDASSPSSAHPESDSVAGEGTNHISDQCGKIKLATDTEAVSALLALGKDLVCFDGCHSPKHTTPSLLPSDSQEKANTRPKCKSSPPPTAGPPHNTPVDLHLHYSGYTIPTAERKRMPTWPLLPQVVPPSVLLPQPYVTWPAEMPEPFPMIYFSPNHTNQAAYNNLSFQPALSSPPPVRISLTQSDRPSVASSCSCSVIAEHERLAVATDLSGKSGENQYITPTTSTV